MRNTKREFCSYLIFDYRGVEAHLSQMAARGWRLEKIGPYFWTYRRADGAGRGGPAAADADSGL